MTDMIQDPETYFRKFIPQRDALLRKLEAEAEKEEIPIIGPVVGELLFLLVRTAGAGRILELGTATGYSAIYLARACDAVDGRVTTLEKEPEMAARAKANVTKAGIQDRIEIMIGDTEDLLPKMNGPFDLIFLDIDKEFYLDALPHCVRLLRVGGLLVADNTGFEPADDFNRAVFSHEQLRAVQLLAFLPRHSPEKDGLCLAVKVE